MKKQRMVLVEARNRKGIDLSEAEMNRLDNVCGAVGSMIAEAVIEGKGKAKVPMSWIRMATDTQEGVELLFDRYELSDARTLRPLIFSLLFELEFPEGKEVRR